MGWGNPVVGGTVLRIPAIQSPDFLSGLLGWIIRLDGSAEFNDLDIRGTFYGNDFILNADGAFFYSGTPSASNLLIAIAGTSATDPFGKPVGQGLTIYGPNGAVISLEDNGTTAALLLLAAGMTHTTINPQIFGGATNAGAANEITSLIMTSGTENGLDDAAIQLFSESADGSFPAQARIEFGGTVMMQVSKAGVGVTKPVVLDTWHYPALDSGWANLASDPIRYRKLPDGNVQWSGAATHAGFTTTQVIISALDPNYVPQISQEIAGGVGTTNTSGIAVSSSGAVQVRANPAGTSTTTCAPQGSYPLV